MNLFKKVSIFTMLMVISILFLTPATAEAATVGEVLTVPEDGWKRYDDNDTNISYNGTGWSTSNNTAYYGGSRHVLSKADLNGTVSFKFAGTKLRLITSVYPTYSNNIYISIDGVTENFTILANAANKVIVYENTSLENTTHTVEIGKVTSGSYTVDFNLDAIDIDDTGYLVSDSQTTNLIALVDNDKVNLSWNSIDNATIYNIKRSTTSGGPYETIASEVTLNYTDTNVTPGITYYYVLSAVVNGVEGLNTNEATATVMKSNNILKLVLEKNEVKQLSVSEDLSDNIELTWTSSDMTTATVDANGTVKALKPGNTVITCTSSDGEYTDIINVLVVDLDYQLAIDLFIGEKCRLAVNDLNDTTKVTWIVNDLTIATITSKGKVTAIDEGLTFITATDEDGNEIGIIYVRVRE